MQAHIDEKNKDKNEKNPTGRLKRRGNSHASADITKILESIPKEEIESKTSSNYVKSFEEFYEEREKLGQVRKNSLLRLNLLEPSE